MTTERPGGDPTGPMMDLPVSDRAEELIGALLALLARVTGMDTFYLTRVESAQGRQDVIASRNIGTLHVPEDLSIPWRETLCSRALESGVRNAEDIRQTLGVTPTAERLGVRSYVMSPVLKPDGSLFGTLCGVSGIPRRVDDNALGLLEVFARVIGDQVAFEEQRAEEQARAQVAHDRLKARSELVAIAEHKLKTPITVILAWTQLLQGLRQGGDPELSEGLSTIRANAQMLKGLVVGLLEEEEIAIRAREFQPTADDVAPLLQRVAKELGKLSKQHVILVDCPPVLSANFDRRALHQALVHLVDNAIKYSPNGGTITLLGEPLEDGAGVHVIDEGVGIPFGIDLFAPFTRGDHDAEGVGLGLHIVAKIAESLGGSIQAGRRDPGPGSIFTLRLQKPMEPSA